MAKRKKKRAGKAPSRKKKAARTKSAGKPKKKKKARSAQGKKKKRAAGRSMKALTVVGSVASCDADSLDGVSVDLGSLSSGDLLGYDGTNITNVTVGSGLQNTSSDLSVNLADLAGDGLTDATGDLAIELGPGVMTSGGALTIQVGNGLMLDGNALACKILDLAGAGLEEEAGTGALTIMTGDGIAVGASGVTINAGTGLTFNGTQLVIDPAADPGNLNGSEPLADVITKINDLLDSLRTAGFLA